MPRTGRYAFRFVPPASCLSHLRFSAQSVYFSFLRNETRVHLPISLSHSMIRLATFNPNSTFARSHGPTHTRPVGGGGKCSRELGKGSGWVVGVTVRARGVEGGILVFVQRDTIFDTQRQVRLELKRVRVRSNLQGPTKGKLTLEI